MKEISVPHKELSVFIKKVLLNAGVREDVAGHVTRGLVQTSLRGVDSHGIRLLPHYVASVKAGRINSDPGYKFEKTSASTGKFDADHTFGHAAGMEAAGKAMELAKKAGTGNIAVFNSSHFGAAAYYSLEIAKHDMIGLSFTHADSLMRTYAGKRAFLGTNPISFSAPVEGEEPLCLDMATTVYNFNKIKQLRERKRPAPEGVGADREGEETTDSEKISMLLPIGGYKGYGLSLMVEVLCGIMTGMPYGPNISSMFKAPLSQKRFLGHFICAMRIDCFQESKLFKKRMAALLKELRSESPMDRNVPVQVAGDPEKKSAAIRSKEGIPMTEAEIQAFRKLSEEYGVKFI
ncbi:MAG: Ldh family oxidoreductase [Dehalococcoidales bacterium]